MENKNILISGASIAGPALAWWLNYYGFNVTVVERALKLREGGYKIDLRGAATDVIKKMALYNKVWSKSTDMISASFINDQGKVKAKMPASFIGMREPEDVEIMRGDLSRIIYEGTPTGEPCEYIFGDSIREIHEINNKLEIKFEYARPRIFDLVIGADGIHSNVRSLLFKTEANYIRNLGDYFFAIFSTPNHLNLDRQELFYARANRVCNMYSVKNATEAKALFIFKEPGLTYDYRDMQGQKNIVAKMFAEGKWEVPALLKSMLEADDFYFDTVNQIHMDTWSSGRVSLIGDAAYGPSLASGQGTSMAIVGAYVLAGELFAANGNYQIAYTAYEKEMRNFVEKNQKLGENVKQMVPATEWSLKLQLLMIRLMPYLPMSGMIIKKIKEEVYEAANGITLKKY